MAWKRASIRSRPILPSLWRSGRFACARSRSTLDCGLQLLGFGLRRTRIAGNAAWTAEDLQEAADDYRNGLEDPGSHPWRVRLSLLQVNATIGDWGQFAKEQGEVETAVISGDLQLAGTLKSGVLPERFKIGLQHPDDRRRGLRTSSGLQSHSQASQPSCPKRQRVLLLRGLLFFDFDHSSRHILNLFPG
jgi:hypothetical protein